MVSRQDLERILAHQAEGGLVVSLFLDTSVNSDNKRTHRVFLNQRRARFDELDSEKRGHPREAIGRVFQRVEEWLENDFREENRGVAIYCELMGDWFEAFQFPVAIDNRMVIDRSPAIAPLAQVLESYDHHGIVLLDRERVRILSVYLGTVLDELEAHGDPYPARHDVQAGGYSQTRYQRRKEEEVRQFFREFAKEVEAFVGRYRPEDLIVLGTDENVARFREFLPESLREMIAFTGPMRVDEPASQVVAWLEPHIEAEKERESRELVDRLRDRVEQDYLATAGFQTTIVALQEGKVDTLIIERNHAHGGTRCDRCGFVFGSGIERCPYDGTPTTPGVDVAEEAIRLAEAQGADVEFVRAGEIEDFAGVGALLRY